MKCHVALIHYNLRDYQKDPDYTAITKVLAFVENPIEVFVQWKFTGSICG